jgi:Uma2 family endonuclease
MIAVQPAQEQRIVLHNISWELYEQLLAAHESSSSPRFTYDRGELEIMSPLPDHEESIGAIERIIELVSDERGIEIRALRSTTFRRADLERGFEPDASFYVRNEVVVRGKSRLDLTVDPPPDLVVEVDLTHSSLGKLGVFAAIGVPEVWRYDGVSVAMVALEHGEYVELTFSREIPGVSASEVTELVSARRTMLRSEWLRRVRTWAHEVPES